LILNYEETLQLILNFIGEKKVNHTFPKQYFKPEVSAKNIGIWKKFSDQAAIEIIQKKLPEYCVAV
jgi:hypothetical protein